MHDRTKKALEGKYGLKFLSVPPGPKKDTKEPAKKEKRRDGIDADLVDGIDNTLAAAVKSLSDKLKKFRKNLTSSNAPNNARTPENKRLKVSDIRKANRSRRRKV